MKKRGAVVKNPPANAGGTRDTGSIPGSGRSPGVGNGNPLQSEKKKNEEMEQNKINKEMEFHETKSRGGKLQPKDQIWSTVYFL